MPTASESGGGPVPSAGAHTLSRRAFLQAASATGLGLAAAWPLAAGARGQAAPEGPLVLGSRHGDPIAELAAALEFDAQRIFRFVADEVRYEPYEGILRGARGTLAARAGNSADQALLLAALLKASLLPCRFAVAAIDAAMGDALLSATAADAPAIRRHTLDALAGTVPGVEPAPPPELPPDVRELAERGLEAAQPVIDWARGQLETTVRELTAALEEGGITLPTDFTPVPPGEVERHVWVQQAATAAWVDLDPTMPGSRPGLSPAGDPQTMDELPEEWAHTVELAVIGETLADGRLEEQTLLGVTERSEAIAGQPIVCLNVRPQGLSGLGVGVADALVGQSAYLPVIMLADEAFVGRNPIRFAAGRSGPGASPADGSSGPLSDEFLEGGAPAAETTAEWVELTVRSPGREPVVVRREIFDRLGPAARAAGAPAEGGLAPVDVINLGDGAGEEVLAALTAHWLIVDTGMPGRDGAVTDIAIDLDARDLALVPQAFHLLRQAAAIELSLPVGVRPIIDAPNVVSYSVHMRPDPLGEHVLETVIDIWHRSYGRAPVVGSIADLLPALVPGVLAHVTERLLAGAASAPTATPPGTGTTSVGGIMERARAEGVPLRVLRHPDDVASLPYPADALARLSGVLGQGWVAVAPARAIVVDGRERAGWWLVDPEAGQAVDMLDDGRGANAFEEAATLQVVVLPVRVPARQFAVQCIVGTLAAVTTVLLLLTTAAYVYEDLAMGAAIGGGGTAAEAWAASVLLRNCLAA